MLRATPWTSFVSRREMGGRWVVVKAYPILRRARDVVAPETVDELVISLHGVHVSTAPRRYGAEHSRG